MKAVRFYLIALLGVLAVSPVGARAASSPGGKNFERFQAAALEPVDFPTRQKLAKRALTYTLKDPGSAQLQDVWMYQSPRGIVLCGEVNAKTGFGGYTGYRGFAVAGDAVLLEQDGIDGYWYAAAALNWCKVRIMSVDLSLR